jgi:hypothetical protein
MFFDKKWKNQLPVSSAKMAVLGPIYFSTLSWPVLFMKMVTYIHSERERERKKERERKIKHALPRQ